MTPENDQVLIARLPDGRLSPDDFEMRAAPMPELGAGGVLVRTSAITIGAGQRAALQGSAGYAGPSTVGTVMGGTGVGVVEATTVDTISPGTLVVGPTGWQRYVALPAGEVRVVDDAVDPALHLSLLGTNGLTAHFGLLEVGRPAPGDTVLVSAASGSVGHLVGQIARIAGCGRVVGVTGSDEKGDVLTGRLGFDAAVNHRSESFRADLKAAVDGGVDVYFDNTGGPVLEAALRRMNTGGRIVCCGVVSQYDTDSPAGGPSGVPGLLVNKRVRMEGFLVFDFADRYDTARADLRAWWESGRLVALHHEVAGLEHAPQAFVDQLAGRNVGTVIVRLDDKG